MMFGVQSCNSVSILGSTFSIGRLKSKQVMRRKRLPPYSFQCVGTALPMSKTLVNHSTFVAVRYLRAYETYSPSIMDCIMVCDKLNFSPTSGHTAKNAVAYALTPNWRSWSELIMPLFSSSYRRSKKLLRLDLPVPGSPRMNGATRHRSYLLSV